MKFSYEELETLNKKLISFRESATFFQTREKNIFHFIHYIDFDPSIYYDYKKEFINEVCVFFNSTRNRFS